MNSNLKNPAIDNSKMNSLTFHSNQSADILQDLLLPPHKLNEVLKFHQRTTWIRELNWNSPAYLEEWLQFVEMTDVLPEYYEEKISFNDLKKRYRNTSTSHRDFQFNISLDKNLLGQILYDAFGRAEGIPTKNYPSAGGLYPVIPLVFILADNAVIENVKKGSYVYDSSTGDLLLLKEFSNNDIEKFKHHSGGIYSNIAIGYGMDIQRAITKYGYRGYRHALIEMGAMTQSFRNSLNTHNLGDLSWSGFNDNPLTKLIGLNPRLSPLVLIQWFGVK